MRTKLGRLDYGVGTIGLLAIVVVCILVTPYLFGRYVQSVLVFSGIYGLAALGVAPLVRSGEVSFAQAAMMGMGAYVSALLVLKAGWSFWLTVPVALLAGALLAAAVGQIVAKLEGYYMALGTLAINMVFTQLAIHLPFTGGTTGLTGLPYVSLFGYQLKSDADWLYFVWFWVLVGTLVLLGQLSGTGGRLLDVIHKSKLLAGTMGVSPASHKLFLFVVTGVYGAAAGVLYVYYLVFINPMPFTLNLSVKLVLMAYMGGTTFALGPVVGAVVIAGMTEGIRLLVQATLGDASIGQWESLVFGLLVILTLMYMQKGITGVRLPALTGRPGKRAEPKGQQTVR